MHSPHAPVNMGDTRFGFGWGPRRPFWGGPGPFVGGVLGGLVGSALLAPNYYRPYPYYPYPYPYYQQPYYY